MFCVRLGKRGHSFHKNSVGKESFEKSPALRKGGAKNQCAWAVRAHVPGLCTHPWSPCPLCQRERDHFPRFQVFVCGRLGSPVSSPLEMMRLWLLSSCPSAPGGRMFEFFPVSFHAHSGELALWKLTAQLFWCVGCFLPY